MFISFFKHLPYLTGIFLLFFLFGRTVETKADDQLRWLLPSKIRNLDPHAYQNFEEEILLYQIYEKLFSQDEDLNPNPNLIERLKQLSPTRWEFTLRENVRFHSGSLLKAEDVVFSLNRAMGIGSSVRPHTTSFGSIASIDDFRFQIILDKPNPLLLVQLAQINIVSKSWIVERSLTEIDTSSKNHFFETNGTGPFKLNQMEGKTLKLFKNVSWWKSSDSLVEIIEILQEPKVDRQREMLEDNLVDFLVPVSTQQVDLLSQNEKIIMHERPSLRTIFLGFKISSGTHKSVLLNPFESIEARRFVKSSLQLEELLSRVYNRQGILSEHIVPPDAHGGPTYQNPNKINLLGSSIQNRKNLLELKTSKLNLDCPNDRYENVKLLCSEIQRQLEKSGVPTKLNLRSSDEHFEDLRQGKSNLFLMGWGLPTYDAHYMLNYLYRSGSSWNFTGYSNPLVDQLIGAIDQEWQPSLREKMLNLTWAILDKELLYFPLIHPNFIWATRNNWSIPVRPDGIPLLYKAQNDPES